MVRKVVKLSANVVGLYRRGSCCALARTRGSVRRRASAHRAERSVSASEDAVAAAIGVRARGGRVRSARGKPRVVLVRAMQSRRGRIRGKGREEIAGRTAKSCECSEKAVFHRWAPLPDSVTKPSRGKKRPGLRLSPGVRTPRSRPVGKSDCRRRGEHAVVVRARRGGTGRRRRGGERRERERRGHRARVGGRARRRTGARGARSDGGRTRDAPPTRAGDADKVRPRRCDAAPREVPSRAKRHSPRRRAAGDRHVTQFRSCGKSR